MDTRIRMLGPPFLAWKCDIFQGDEIFTYETDGRDGSDYTSWDEARPRMAIGQ